MEANSEKGWRAIGKRATDLPGRRVPPLASKPSGNVAPAAGVVKWRDGQVFFNFMPRRSRDIDNQREGWLLYKRPEVGEGE